MIPQLCFITDPQAPLPILDQAEKAARGGARWVQLRHKTLPDADFARLARTLRERLSALGSELVINDRVEVARHIGAFGLHIGQSDGDPTQIRSRIGPDMVLGLSIENAAQLSQIPAHGVDYLGVGPIRATGSKSDHAPPIGFEGLTHIASATPLPCMAIGGLSAADIPTIAKCGCAGVAVISAISRANDPQRAAQAITDLWKAAAGTSST
ncbi:thiamine phosphate synthase [Yoonia sp. 2307UL14-13]|uniref:thiamine phosphate synthase n=1 Tax=Yoonia sp. 2307UL14-13 TaxID=3126506 RepID=UPI0030ABF5A2